MEVTSLARDRPQCDPGPGSVATMGAVRTCSDCGLTKPLKDFTQNRGTPWYYRSCKRLRQRVKDLGAELRLLLGAARRLAGRAAGPAPAAGASRPAGGDGHRGEDVPLFGRHSDGRRRRAVRRAGRGAGTKARIERNGCTVPGPRLRTAADMRRLLVLLPLLLLVLACQTSAAHVPAPVAPLIAAALIVMTDVPVLEESPSA